MRRLIWVFAVIKLSCFGTLFFFNRQRIPDQVARMRRLIQVYLLFSCGIWTALMFRRIFFFFFFFFSNIANSRSGCADAQAHMGIRCYHEAYVQLSCFGAALFVLTDSEFQTKLRGCTGLYGYSLFSYGVGTFLLVCEWSGNVQPLLWCDAVFFFFFFFFMFLARKTIVNSSSWIPVPNEDHQLEQE